VTPDLPEALTVLRARDRRLAKLVRSDGSVVGHDRARHVDARAAAVPDLGALHRLLVALLHRPECCIIRGAPVAGDRAQDVRRLAHPCRRTGDPATFRDVPRRWIALDMEGVTLPPDVPAADLAGSARIALATLPSAFQGRACIVQATASHGLRPDLRLRLWLWLDRPAWGHELRRWLRGTPADPSVFGTVQPIYSAAPLFEGMADPLPRRLLALPGAPLVPVPSPTTLAPPQRPSAPPPVLHPMQGSRYVRAALERAAGRIATAEKRHPAIVAEARSLARLVRAGLLDERQMCAVLTAAAEAAGKGDADEIAACIAWGLDNPSPGPVPELRQ
jgi:hypothetical protein